MPLRLLSEVCLSFEELEAVRLRDIEDLDQEQCAGRMNISRPTFQRVLKSARRKIADGLIGGGDPAVYGRVQAQSIVEIWKAHPHLQHYNIRAL